MIFKIVPTLFVSSLAFAQSIHPNFIEFLSRAKTELKGTSTLIVTDRASFSDLVASDLNASNGNKVVAFLAGYSAAGHDASVVDDINKMQAAAKEHFNLSKPGSAYGLIVGANRDGGVNERFEEGQKSGKLVAAVDPSGFKSYGTGAISVAQWGGMLAENRGLYLQDAPPDVYELKTSPQSPSGNSESLRRIATQANAGVHIMMTEGGEIGLKEVAEYLNNHHQDGKTALIHLGIGFDPTKPAGDKGVRGAEFLARYLSLNPELIDAFERSGVKFMVFDKTSGTHFRSIKEYFKSGDWKARLAQYTEAQTQVKGDKVKAMKAAYLELESKVKSETDTAAKKALSNQLKALGGEIALIENRANVSEKIRGYIGELGRIVGQKTGLGLLEVSARSAVDPGARTSGKGTSPVEAAKGAAGGAK